MVSELWPKDRLLRHGAEALSDAELLAVVLRNGRPGESAVEVARQILSRTGKRQRIPRWGIAPKAGEGRTPEQGASRLLFPSRHPRRGEVDGDQDWRARVGLFAFSRGQGWTPGVAGDTIAHSLRSQVIGGA